MSESEYNFQVFIINDFLKMRFWTIVQEIYIF